MNAIDQQIALGKWLQLRRVEAHPYYGDRIRFQNEQGDWEWLPDYFDLNVIHQLEKTLTEEQAQVHFDHLSDTTGARLETAGIQYGVCHFLMYNASVEHRLEALLKTLNLWVE